MSLLYLVPTPVGNLEDMTFRAVRVLKECKLILAEDTRTSGVLLRHYGIETPVAPFHQHNEHKVTSGLVSRIATGEIMALITDAGTPGISDPGFLLARACLEAGIEVQCLPGPTAIIPAVVMSGIPCDRFCFEGFLPVKKGRQTRLIQLQEETRTMVFYESPHRVQKSLKEFAAYFGTDRQAAAVREISKKFEETVRGDLTFLNAHFTEYPPRGEFVLVVAGAPERKKKKQSRHEQNSGEADDQAER